MTYEGSVIDRSLGVGFWKDAADCLFSGNSEHPLFHLPFRAMQLHASFLSTLVLSTLNPVMTTSVIVSISAPLLELGHCN